MTAEDIKAHGKRYSKSFNYGGSVWSSDFHGMALKTVLKRLLSHYGILSIDMHRAVEADQGVVLDAGTPQQPLTVDYIDAPTIEDEATPQESSDDTPPAAPRESGQEG